MLERLSLDSRAESNRVGWDTTLLSTAPGHTHCSPRICTTAMCTIPLLKTLLGAGQPARVALRVSPRETLSLPLCISNPRHTECVSTRRFHLLCLARKVDVCAPSASARYPLFAVLFSCRSVAPCNVLTAHSTPPLPPPGAGPDLGQKRSGTRSILDECAVLYGEMTRRQTPRR